MFNLVYIFVQIDDFINLFFKKDSYRLLHNPNRKRNRKCSMTISEIITIMIMFHFSDKKTFKSFFLSEVSKDDFPNLLSYSRFVQVSKSAFYYLYASERGIQKADQNGIYIIDSTKLEVCNFLRKSRNKTFKNVAGIGKNLNGWFFGFKLHLITNEKGELVNFAITKGNVDDRKPVRKLTKNLSGIIIGDRGYIDSKLKHDLSKHNLKLITNKRKNMKKQNDLSVLKKIYYQKEESSKQ